MKKAALFVALVLWAGPAFAQFGAIDRFAKKAQELKTLADIGISEKDERAIGEQVSALLIERFGVYQDPAVAKYVTLVGTVLAQASARPGLEWKFIVLDSDGVNAYAAPGGIVHITRGALGLIKSEAELAGVLGHEIVHVTAKHSVRAIQKSKVIKITSEQASERGGLAGTVVGQVAEHSYNLVFENKYGRDDENESDKVGITLASKAGYAPTGMNEFLNHLADRNKDQKEPSGLFASHPQLKERTDRMSQAIADDKLTSTATVQPRYATHITFDAKSVVEIAASIEGAAGAVGGGSSTATAPKTEAKKEEEKPKKKGFGIGSIASSAFTGKQKESTQASASAGSRMAGPDTQAPGGTNKTPVTVTLTAAEIDEFRKGIA
jgi:beta-barrel assembly-enhancing protease